MKLTKQEALDKQMGYPLQEIDRLMDKAHALAVKSKIIKKLVSEAERATSQSY